VVPPSPLYGLLYVVSRKGYEREFLYIHSTKGEHMKYTISVTKTDIKKGMPGNFENCPIAHSVKRKFKKQLVTKKLGIARQGVIVGMANLHLDLLIKGKRKKIIFGMPIKAQKFISSFDDFKNKRRHSMRPFKFTIDI
jgi:hypothetical protein